MIFDTSPSEPARTRKWDRKCKEQGSLLHWKATLLTQAAETCEGMNVFGKLGAPIGAGTSTMEQSQQEALIDGIT